MGMNVCCFVAQWRLVLLFCSIIFVRAPVRDVAKA